MRLKSLVFNLVFMSALFLVGFHANTLAAAESHQSKINKFYSLPLSHSDGQRIHKLISKMGYEKLYKLLWKKKEMEDLGKSVDHVHPFRFLGVVFADPYLKKAMKNVKGNPFKWNRFIGGLSDRLHLEASRNNVNQYVHGFANHVGRHEGDIQGYINRKDFRGLVGYLIN